MVILVKRPSNDPLPLTEWHLIDGLEIYLVMFPPQPDNFP